MEWKADMVAAAMQQLAGFFLFAIFSRAAERGAPLCPRVQRRTGLDHLRCSLPIFL